MILTGLSKYRDGGLFIMRIGLGIAFIAHGLPLLLGGPPKWAGLGSGVGMPAPVVFGFIVSVIGHLTASCACARPTRRR